MSEPSVTFAHGMAVLHPDGTTREFWEACRQHRLVYAACASCGTARIPPASVCPTCGVSEVRWQPVSGLGTVYSFTIARHSFHQKVDDSVPYVIAVIALDDAPPRLISNVVGVDPDDVSIGLPVEVVWDDVSADVAIPRFMPRPA